MQEETKTGGTATLATVLNHHETLRDFGCSPDQISAIASGGRGRRDTQQYVLYSPDGESKVISHRQLQLFCKLSLSAEKTLLAGDMLETEDGYFYAEELE